MPKNKGKGGKNRRRGKNENFGLKREFVEKDGDNQGINMPLYKYCYGSFQFLSRSGKCSRLRSDSELTRKL